MKSTLQQNRVENSGVEFEFGEQRLIVPPLTSGQVEANVDLFDKHDGIEMKKAGDIVARLAVRRELVMMAVKRNYPNITEEDMKEFVTTENSEALFQAIMGISKSAKIKILGETAPVNVS